MSKHTTFCMYKIFYNLNSKKIQKCSVDIIIISSSSNLVNLQAMMGKIRKNQAV
jgi:hypothetical protein